MVCFLAVSYDVDERTYIIVEPPFLGGQTSHIVF